MRVSITGGAGFVGSNLAMRIKRDRPESEVIVLDNLHRPGSELNLPRLRGAGIVFIEGDVRNTADISKMGDVDVLLDCAAEPSVLAGQAAGNDFDARYAIDTNLLGTVNCLEHLRGCGGRMIFLSSSRVYAMAALRDIPLNEVGTRLIPDETGAGLGWSRAGISEEFSVTGPRSLYGASKLAAEMMIEEYADMHGIEAAIYRCGVLAGPWQMGKVEQGVFTLWMARHVFGGALNYVGYGGTGSQVRDVLHIDDLADLLMTRLDDLGGHRGQVFNIGGGLDGSVSLAELTQLCSEISGQNIDIGAIAEDRANDIPWYVTDTFKIQALDGWSPKRDPKVIMSDIHGWIMDHKAMLEPIFGQVS
jgi:CDP-paratose 2-epimerase